MGSQKLCNILVHAGFQCIYHVIEAVQAMEKVDSIMVMGVLLCIVSLYVGSKSHKDECAT